MNETLMIFDKITNKSKNLEGFISCPLGQSFRKRVFVGIYFQQKGDY